MTVFWIQLLFAQVVTFDESPFVVNDASNINTGVVRFEMRHHDDNDSVIAMTDLATPIDIYLPLNVSRLNTSYFAPVEVTQGETTLVGMQTLDDTSVGLRVFISVNGTEAGRTTFQG